MEGWVRSTKVSDAPPLPVRSSRRPLPMAVLEIRIDDDGSLERVPNSRPVALRQMFSVNEVEVRNQADRIEFGLTKSSIAETQMTNQPRPEESGQSHRAEDPFEATFDVPIQPSIDDSIDAPQLNDKAAGLASDTRKAADKLVSDMKETATGLRQAAKEQASDFAAGIGEELSKTAEGQKERGVETLQTYMRAITSAADQLEAQSPSVARTVRSAASKIGTLSDTISSRNVNDLAKAAGEMARDQPLMFIGGAALAGFALSRFLKSSTGKANQ
jgi:hypothetical protein